MNSTRGGLTYLDFGGTSGGASKSLSSSPPMSILIKPLDQLGMNASVVVHGNELTCDFLGGLKKKYGADSTLKYTSLESGWTYVWQIGTKRLIVKDNLGLITYYPNKDTLSSLGMCWNILQSYQFIIVIDGTNTGSAVFPIGVRNPKRQDVNYVGYSFMGREVDPTKPNDPNDPDTPDEPPIIYPPDDPHNPYYGYLADWGDFWQIGLDTTPSPLLHILGNLGNEDERKALLSNLTIPNIETTGNWPQALWFNSQAESGSREKIERQACMSEFSVSMLYLIATLAKMDKPYIAPWLLYSIFKWVGYSSLVQSEEEVYELSPWWG